MANISDVIEKFIISSMGDDGFIEISRNSLAKHFACVPSQINYVLETRFTIDRGFAKESRRGSAGFVKISRIKNDDKNAYLGGLVSESIGDELSAKRMEQILDKLIGDNIINDSEKLLVMAALDDESLAMPLVLKDNIRAQAFKRVLVALMKK